MAFRKMTGSPSIRQNLKSVLDKLNGAYDGAPSAAKAAKVPRLVAVSKTKPKEDVIAAYDAGQRHFGENYVQELMDKSNDPEILERCPEIKWHFIGQCQTNKVTKIKRTRNLACIETIVSEQLASKLQQQLAKKDPPEIVDVMIQVNTSGEENKGGVAPGKDTVALVNYVMGKCPNLKVTGLMTIGALGNSVPRDKPSEPDSNPDFLSLIQCRKEVSEALELDETGLELSMGMSNDFEEAIRMGSTNIRVGSSIFGARNYPAAKQSNPPPADTANISPDVIDAAKKLEDTKLAAV